MRNALKGFEVLPPNFINSYQITLLQYCWHKVFLRDREKRSETKTINDADNATILPTSDKIVFFNAM